MKKYILFSSLILLTLLSGFYLWQYMVSLSAPALKPAPIAQKPSTHKKPNRCKKPRATQASLALDGNVLWTKPLTDIVLLPGSFTLKKGRHKGSHAIPIDSFLTEHKEVSRLEMVSCQGEPQSYIASELRADPARYVMVVNNAGIFKLLEKENDGYRTKPLQKNIMQIRLFQNIK